MYSDPQNSHWQPRCGLADALRQRLWGYATRLIKAAGYSGAATVEFLVAGTGANAEVYFLEVNPRVQVEHTVTEEVAPSPPFPTSNI